MRLSGQDIKKITHFLMIFKQPRSVAMRHKNERLGKEGRDHAPCHLPLGILLETLLRLTHNLFIRLF